MNSNMVVSTENGPVFANENGELYQINPVTIKRIVIDRLESYELAKDVASLLNAEMYDPS